MMFFGRPKQYPMEGPAVAPGQMPGQMPGMPGPMPGMTGMPGMPGMPGPMAGPVLPPGGLLNMDIGPNPGLVNMDIGGPIPCGEMEYHEVLEPRVHVVACGDSVWKIAQQYNVSMQTIIQANDLRYPDALHPGQRLVIPEGMHY
jgi:nucleoid-associated protein YgaU